MKPAMSMMLTGVVAAIIGGAVSVAALQIFIHAPAPSLVTADLTGIANAKTLTLAARDLDPKELEEASKQWAGEFQALLHAIAKQNNIIILPKGLGIYGARDVTAELRQFMEVRQ